LHLLQLKYRFIRQWLNLHRNDGIAKAIKALDRLDATADLGVADAAVRKQLYERYGL
jgi:hypothetical protein